MAKQSNKGAPAPSTPPKAANTPSVAKYVLGPKVANCRATHTQLGWQQIQDVLAANPNGATMVQLIAATTPNVQFAWYAYKNGWLALAA